MKPSPEPKYCSTPSQWMYPKVQKLIFVSQMKANLLNTGTEMENAGIDNSDIRQIERHNEIPQHTYTWMIK